MRKWGFVLLLGIVLSPPRVRADQQVNQEAIVAAARELARALDLLQQVQVMEPNAIPPRGLNGQTGDALSALSDFRQALNSKASRDDLYVAFDAVDRKVKGILDLLPLWDKSSGGLRLASRRLQTADHDLQFAVSIGDDAPARGSQVAYRQTLAMLGFSEDLQATVTWVFAGRDPLMGWKNALTDFRQSVVAFQRLQQKKAGQDDVKQQLAQVEQSWGKLMDLYNNAGNDKLLLQNSVARVDQVLGRLATRFGVKRRPPLSDYYSNY